MSRVDCDAAAVAPELFEVPVVAHVDQTTGATGAAVAAEATGATAAAAAADDPDQVPETTGATEGVTVGTEAIGVAEGATDAAVVYATEAVKATR